MQKIIVASDLSERSRPAVRRAVELALASGAELLIVSVVNDDFPEALSQPVQVGATSILTEQVTTDAKGRALRFEVKVRIGDPLTLLNETVAEADADLLVLGRHRRRAFLDEMRETTVEHMIRSSRIPVLLVTGSTREPYRRVLSGITFSEVCTSVLRLVPQVAPEAEITLFHAHEVSFRNEAERDFEAWKVIYGVPPDLPEPIFVEARPRDALDDLMEEHGYDLLAIGGHTRAEGGRFFIGRFTSGLVRNPPCDLLIAKNPAKKTSFE